MSDQSSGSDDDDAQAPLAGERLAAARRDQDISLAEIAKELHLDEAKVQALEQNQFEALGAPVFAKGHLRKYAEIVGVPLDDVLADYYQLNRSAGAPPIIGPPRERPQELDLGRWVLPAVGVAFIAGIAWLWISSGSPLPSLGGDEATDDQPLAVPLPASPGIADGLPADGDEYETTEDETSIAADEGATESLDDRADTGDADDATAGAGPAATDPPATADQDVPDAAPAAASVSVTLNFRGECWTEITDADGARLFFDLGRAGRNVTVSGTPPLRVLLGSYENVDVAVDGDPFAIPASSRRGETARFTIAAP